MQHHLIRLFKGTFIYSGGQVLSRIITFILLPLTTTYLTPEDYGILGSLALIGQFLSGLFSLGFGVSLARCYWATDVVREKHGIVWTAFAALLLNAAFLMGCSYFFSSHISGLVLNSEHYADLVMLTFLQLGISAALLPFAIYLRVEEKAALVASLSLLEVLMSIGLSVYFVMVLERGVRGAVEANLIAQGISFLLMLVICSRILHFSFHWISLPDMLKIGYPYIFGLFGYFMLQYSSRYMLLKYTDMNEVGLFSMGSNFARIIELAVTGFISAWPPFYTSFVNKLDEAVHVFGRVLSYYVMGVSALLILFFALAKPVVFCMVQPPFHSVWTIVGILACAQALWGVYSISAASFILFKKSVMQVVLESCAGLAGLSWNYFLIPLFNKEGAAIATFFSFLCLISVSFILNQRLLQVQYEKKRLLMTISGLILSASLTFIPINHIPVYMALMAGNVIAFYAYLWKYCLTASEKGYILSFLPSKRLSQPA